MDSPPPARSASEGDRRDVTTSLALRAGHDGLRDRWLSAVEVALVALLLAGQIWLVWEWLPLTKTGEHIVRASMIVSIVGVLAFSFLRVRDSREELGLTRANLKSGWLPAALFTAIGLAGLAITTAAQRVSIADVNFNWLVSYSHGLLGQQLALQWFLNNRVYQATGRSTLTVVLCVVVFTLLHAPNPGLMLSVIPASAFWCWHFRRYRNMPALLISHLILGGAAMVLLGDGPLLRLRVGPPAWRLLVGE